MKVQGHGGVDVCLTVWKTARPFPKMAVPFYTPTGNVSVASYPC